VIKIINEKLNIGFLSTAYHSSFILMENKDLDKDFKKHINWILFGTGPAIIEAFNRNELDIGYIGITPAIVGIDQGVRVKCVAGGHIEGTLMIANEHYKSFSEEKGSLFNIFNQFAGKKVGVPSLGSIHEVILNYYLKKFKLNKKIDIKYYSHAEFIALDLKRGLLDGGVGTPALAAFASTMLNSKIIIPPDKLYENNPSYGIFCQEKLIENDPETIFKFLQHHKVATTLIREAPLEAAEKIARVIKIIDFNYVKSILEISPKYCIALSDKYITASMNLVKIIHELGYIKTNLEIKDIFNFEFIKKIHPEKEHY